MSIPTTTQTLDTMDEAAFGALIAAVTRLPSARLGVVAARLMRVGACVPRAAMLATAALEELELRARDEPGNQVDILQVSPDGESTERI